MKVSISPTASAKCCHTRAKSSCGIRLVMDVVSTERDFKDVQIQDRSRVHALKALVLMSKFGVTTVLTVPPEARAARRRERRCCRVLVQRPAVSSAASRARALPRS